MELSQTELQHRIKGLSRRERRAQARESWDLLELWRDPEFKHMSRQAARDASWKMYWTMWKEDYQPPARFTPKETSRVVKKEGGFWKGLKNIVSETTGWN